MQTYHCSLNNIDAPALPRVVLWRHNGVTRVGTLRKLTKEEKRMLRPSRQRRQRQATRVANLDEYQ